MFASLLKRSISSQTDARKDGFFTCKSEVRQGDPLSPLLFFLAEDVLRRGMTKLVENKQVKLIKASRNSYVPSHVLYADDIMGQFPVKGTIILLLVLVSTRVRLVIVKSVIQSMMIPTMLIYSWPTSVLKNIHRWAGNFIWSGEIDTRKIVTVTWDKCCRPYEEGGLGTRSLVTLNEDANLK
ncbi:uncharacterized protein LOC131648687 [Vicia villosa]|uniref:uncharacterized protein LOC131648687 n=1 Tax=Vicia villosa TaxID=3911 RepID=UPI00273B5553|nr:uncharacterized protein LOC131648687 [Vicia villosa]